MHNWDNEAILLVNENKLSETELETLFALKALKAHPEILDSVLYFEKLVYVLNKLKPNTWSFEPVSILHLCKAFVFFHKEYPDKVWDREIVEYIAHIAYDEGWMTLPSNLIFAQNSLDLLGNRVTLDEEQLELQKLKHQAVEMYLHHKE
jgi:hypothetical protein